MQKTGLWLIGARGGVATTAIVGLAALHRELVPPIGLVSDLEQFRSINLIGWDQLVVGGHEIRKATLTSQAFQLADASRAIDRRIVEQVSAELDEIDREIRPGTMKSGGATIEGVADPGFPIPSTTVRETVRQIQADWADFCSRKTLPRMVVVNVASTEPHSSATEMIPETWNLLEDRLDDPEFSLPPSVVYALAAIDAGLSYVNFTPSIGSNLPALRELALARGVCHVGRDAKTGETLLKSVLAPMFSHRNLDVMSWVGHNIIGNMDGQVLNDPANKATKVASKDHLLREIMGYSPQTHISIEYIRSLGDWKTAWDHIHFRGFLGTPMTMQFTWQGCDSILAAPLLLDLARFTELAARRGEAGELGWLSCFFKSPQGTDVHDFSKQFEMLCEWAGQPVQLPRTV